MGTIRSGRRSKLTADAPCHYQCEWQRALGNKIEILSYDNQSQPAEALVALKTATDQNIPILQCAGSDISAADCYRMTSRRGQDLFSPELQRK
jgi:hypothetical protein